ncbi:hypothetical protein IK146_02355 [Candidatus Saccharibacteria bacterium]|nr:hypothetical protein [Candidatus Saccharibacteria bacterium]
MGIKIFTGDDRVKIGEQVVRELGEGYEVFEGESLTRESLPSLFLGGSLFSVGERKILIKDFGENSEVWNDFAEKINDYLKTDSEIVIWETKIDKRLSSTKNIVKSGVEIIEFKLAPSIDMKAVFNIYDMALKDGMQAIRELEKIESAQDPYMFFGLMVSQALKKLEWRPRGIKEKRILKELAVVDMQMKSTAVEPWTLVKSFLLRLATI